MKRQIEIEDTLPQIVDDTIDSLKQMLIEYCNENKPDTLPCLSNDIDYDGRFHELVDSAVPIYTAEIRDIMYLHGNDVEDAFDDAGIGTKEDAGWPAGWKAAAIYCYIERACWEWWNLNAEEVFEEWQEANNE